MHVMKFSLKHYLILSLTLGMCSAMHAQLGTLFYSKHHNIAVTATGGMAQEGTGGMIALDYKINRYDFVQFGVSTTFSDFPFEETSVPINAYSFNTGFFYDLFRNNSRIIAVAIGAGGVAGYEIINNDDQEVEGGRILNIKNKFIYGPYAGIDIDIFITQIISLTIKTYEFYHINSDIGNLTPYIGAGIKLIVL